jgi:hypothetical protein
MDFGRVIDNDEMATTAVDYKQAPVFFVIAPLADVAKGGDLSAIVAGVRDDGGSLLSRLIPLLTLGIRC